MHPLIKILFNIAYAIFSYTIIYFLFLSLFFDSNNTKNSVFILMASNNTETEILFITN